VPALVGNQVLISSHRKLLRIYGSVSGFVVSSGVTLVIESGGSATFTPPRLREAPEAGGCRAPRQPD